MTRLEQLEELQEYLAKDVCMESIGKYWIPVYNILEKDCSIVLANPKYVKANHDFTILQIQFTLNIDYIK